LDMNELDEVAARFEFSKLRSLLVET